MSLLEENKIEETIKRISKESFTVLDFIQVFIVLYPENLKRLEDRFGRLGERRRYTVKTYLSNRLDLYSQKPSSLLKPFLRYSAGRFKGYRVTTEDGCKNFGNACLALATSARLH